MALPGEVPPSGKRSDFVAQLALTAFQDWSADIGVQWNPQNRAQRAHHGEPAVQARPRHGDQPRLPLRARRTSTELVPQAVGGVVSVVPQTGQQGFDQIELSAAWPIAGNWNVFAAGGLFPARPGAE